MEKSEAARDNSSRVAVWLTILLILNTCAIIALAGEVALEYNPYAKVADETIVNLEPLISIYYGLILLECIFFICLTYISVKTD